MISLITFLVVSVSVVAMVIVVLCAHIAVNAAEPWQRRAPAAVIILLVTGGTMWPFVAYQSELAMPPLELGVVSVLAMACTKLVFDWLRYPMWKPLAFSLDLVMLSEHAPQSS